MNILARPLKAMLPFRTFGSPLYQEHDGVRVISSRHGELYPLKKSTGTFRIVCFGGSTTENLDSFQKNKTHYPLLLQGKLRDHFKTKDIEVINIGNSGYATPHSIILLALDVLSWDADLLIISHNINDLSAMYFPNLTFDYSNKYSLEYYSVPDYQDRFTYPNIIFQHFQLYWFLKGRLDTYLSKELIEQKSYGENPDRLAVAIFERNLRSFVTLARQHGAEVLMASQPLEPSSGHRPEPFRGLATYPMSQEFIAHHAAFNRTIEKVAQSTHAWFLDNEGLLQGNKKYFIDDVHYTKEGVERIAQNYADYLFHKIRI